MPGPDESRVTPGPRGRTLRKQGYHPVTSRRPRPGPARPGLTTWPPPPRVGRRPRDAARCGPIRLRAGRPKPCTPRAQRRHHRTGLGALDKAMYVVTAVTSLEPNARLWETPASRGPTAEIKT